MWNNLPPVIRLLLCLTLSTGLHGGLAYYDWAMSPAESDQVAAPVVVSLLPVAEALPKMTKVMPQETLPQKKQNPVRKASRPAPVAKTSLPRLSAKKVLLEKTRAVDVPDKVQDEPSATERVCLSPQDVVSDVSPVTEADETGKEEKKVLMAALATTANKVVSDLSFPASNSLVEAVPIYRSNPLPEYPLLARRKHWEGVVWLLVDVSPEGLVEDLRVEETCGYRLLDRAAGRTVKRWQFSPATRGGLPVSSQVRIPVRFRLEGS